jgi:hypothetical protein
MPFDEVARRALATRFADRRIFVAIASYRDRDLPRTVQSAIDAAAEPSRLRFGICQQHGPDDAADLDRWRDDPRVLINAVPYGESRGVCWARARTQALYDGEPFVLQIDAHMRFADGWDDRCSRMLRGLDGERSILTNYPLGFHVDGDGTEQRERPVGARRLELAPDRPDGSFRIRTALVTGAGRPGRQPFLAAGFCFGPGSLYRDVAYDPDIYFEGEEITLAVRAYTHGYDLHYPDENVVWHWYDHPSPLHWDDHPDHSTLAAKGAARVRRVLAGDPTLGRFGLGTRRSLPAWEHLAGLRITDVGTPVHAEVGEQRA